MSYDISFWDYVPGSVAGDFDRALAVFETLQDKPRSLTSRLPEFARAAEALLTAPDQDEALRRHFQGFARQADGKEAVLTVELPATDRLPVFRQLVELATAKGLAVLDGQMGILFLPDGRVLPEEAGYAWQDIKAELDAGDVEGELPRKLTDFKKMVERDLGGVLKSQGFRKGKHPQFGFPLYIRDVGDGIRQYVTISCEDPHPGYEIRVQVLASCDAVTTVLQKFQFEHSKFPAVLAALLSGYADYKRYIESISDYKDFMETFDRYVVFLMNGIADIPSLDATVNGAFSEKLTSWIYQTIWFPSCLVIAWLAGSEKIEDLISTFDEITEKRWRLNPAMPPAAYEENKVRHEKWAALKAYVRSTPPPER